MWYQVLIRIAGVVFILSGCWFAGRHMEDCLKRRKYFFRDTIGLLQYLEKEMLHHRTAMNESLYEASQVFEEPWKLILIELSKCVSQYSGNTFSELWLEILKKHLKKSFLKEEEWPFLERMSSAFCGSDTAVQKTFFESSLEQMKELERKASEEYAAKGILYRRLSLLAAAFMILILI